MAKRDSAATAPSQALLPQPGQYIVVARRYRPQTFDELVGQAHVAQALSGAIASARVGHAYLFTGARGVGKTSAARILAKALNCVQGPTPVPCNQCDICRSISAGDDVDVLEIDGASNRGIDEMRELRHNVNIRPSRARFKIYIIDEVHMLTREAFNALLKTLEEPPEHVKFIFCTTEPEKIPVTILSRCQRFDFAGIDTRSIAERLRQIVAAEGVEAQPEALEMLARRAAGSMRDSQSLLEQLLSFGGSRITLDDVHRMLGTAAAGRLRQLAGRLVERDAAGALAEFDAALADGADVGPLMEQLLGYFRDLMVAAAGCPPDALMYGAAGDQSDVLAAARQLGLETVLAAMQVLDQALSRLRYSTHGRIVAELALVRICHLENLDRLADLIADVRAQAPTASSGPPGRTGLRQAAPQAAVSPAAKKKIEPAPSPAGSTTGGNEVGGSTAESVAGIWQQAVAQVSEMLREQLSRCESVAILAPNRLVVSFRPKYTSCKTFCERPDQLARLETALQAVCGHSTRVEFAVLNDEPATVPGAVAPKRRFATPRELLLERADNALVRRAAELFDARPVRLEEPDS